MIKRKDNRGFTLVELLIAMAIIAIVLTPLYSNFRQSTYLNGKAKKAMDATNMASDIMEGISAYGPDEIITGFDSIDEELYTKDHAPGATPVRTNYLNVMPNYVQLSAFGEATPDGSGGFTMVNNVMSYAANSSGAYTTALSAANPTGVSTINYDDSTGNSLYVKPAPSVSSVGDPFARYLRVKKSSDSKYYFYATDVADTNNISRKGLTSNDYTYDIIVELNANDSETGFGNVNTGSGDPLETNENIRDGFKEVYITNLNPLFDGVFTEEVDTFDAGAMALEAYKSGTSTATRQDLIDNMIRNIVVDIEHDNITDQDKVLVSEVYSIKSSWSHASDFSSSQATVIDHRQICAVKKLRDLYIYYTPNYKSTSGGDPLDRIIILNHDRDGVASTYDATEVNLHLMRIRTAETTSDLEANYKCSVNVFERHSESADDMLTTYSDEICTHIYSNLRDNLDPSTSESDQKANRREGSRNVYKFSPYDFPSDLSQVMTYYTAGLSIGNHSHMDNLIVENGGLKSEATDRLYSVKIYVYESGSADAGFPADKRVTTYDGSALE